MFWPRPDPPLLSERFALVASAIPPGTLAAGQTAGWVWTGMGSPTPFSLIAKQQPAPSPLVRHSWKIRGTTPSPEDLVSRCGLECLTKQATADDLWECDGDDTVVSSQLFFLLGDHDDLATVSPGGLRASRRAEILTQWRSRYPWATRYTS